MLISFGSDRDSRGFMLGWGYARGLSHEDNITPLDSKHAYADASGFKKVIEHLALCA